ncbi:MAG TPA: hypothetical protein VEU33_05445 [Archangium sp.]|nr:hypothetical protein [Archangium sp.]
MTFLRPLGNRPGVPLLPTRGHPGPGGGPHSSILLVRDLKALKCDVAAYRCLVYRNIRDLETQLSRELQHLG